MSIWINYKKKLSSDKSTNLIYFVDEKFNVKSIKKHIPKSDYIYILDLLKVSDLTKKIIIFNISSKKKNNYSFLKKKH